MKLSISNKEPCQSFLALLAILLSSLCAQGGFFPLNVSGSFNFRLQSDLGMPQSLINNSGLSTLLEVPFAIPTLGNNGWKSFQPTFRYPNDTNQQRVLTIPANVQDATTLFTLINSYWGAEGPASYAKIEVFGTAGAYAQFNLVGGVNIRDFNQATWMNHSLNTAEVLSWTGGTGEGSSQRLDRQRFTLPGSFLGQTLTEVRLTDNGSTLQQRTFLVGATVQNSLGATIPVTSAIEPAVAISFPAAEGQIFQVQQSFNMEPNSWTSFGPPILGDGTQRKVFDTTSEAPRKFYRVISP